MRIIHLIITIIQNNSDLSILEGVALERALMVMPN